MSSPPPEPTHDPSQLDSDRDSDALSEIDEDQFGDYDPTAARILEKPVEIDEDVARTLKAGKRKGQAEKVKKPKEGRRDKKKKNAAASGGAGAGDGGGDGFGEDNDGADGEILTGKRVRKGVGAGSGSGTGSGKGSASAARVQEDQEREEDLTPEERRKRAIERAARGEVKKVVKRRKRKDEDDLEEELDELIANLKRQMEMACQMDNQARSRGEPALQKLKLLPDVMAFINRTAYQSAVVDPEINFLQNLKFFLEPLDDASLPAYNIQRDIFAALARLPIEKDSLIQSGIGKVVLFYTKSKRPETSIKRMAERLLGEWSRPILKRTDDYKKRRIETREYDPRALFKRRAAAAATADSSSQHPSSSSQFSLAERPALSAMQEQRERALADPKADTSRARLPGLPTSYKIAPKSTWDSSQPRVGASFQPVGAAADSAFRKLTQKRAGRKGPY